MWECVQCKFSNKPQFDLCAKCGSTPEGQRDPIFHAFCCWRRRVLCLLLLLPFLYMSSYFLLGSYQSGFTFKWSGLTSKQYTYYDRAFPFDPWIYKPIAYLEYRYRGQRSQVLIEDGRYRGGQPIYAYGPFE